MQVDSIVVGRVTSAAAGARTSASPAHHTARPRAPVPLLQEACQALETQLLVSDWYALKDELGPATLAAAKLAFADTVVTPFLSSLAAILDTNKAKCAGTGGGITVPCTTAPLGLLHTVGSGVTIADVQAYSTCCFVERHLAGATAGNKTIADFVAGYNAM